MIGPDCCCANQRQILHEMHTGASGNPVLPMLAALNALQGLTKANKEYNFMLLKPSTDLQTRCPCVSVRRRQHISGNSIETKSS